MTATLIAQSRPVARKAHGCGYCLGRIEPGTTYLRQVLSDLGQAYTFKAHEVCHFVAWDLDPYEGMVDPGELLAEIALRGAA